MGMKKHILFLAALVVSFAAAGQTIPVNPKYEDRRQLFLKWRFVYPMVAHRTVDIDDRTPDQVADAVRDTL